MVDVSFDGDEEVVRRISSVNCQVDEKSVVKKLPSRKSHRTNTKPKKTRFKFESVAFGVEYSFDNAGVKQAKMNNCFTNHSNPATNIRTMKLILPLQMSIQ